VESLNSTLDCRSSRIANLDRHTPNAAIGQLRASIDQHQTPTIATALGPLTILMLVVAQAAVAEFAVRLAPRQLPQIPRGAAEPHDHDALAYVATLAWTAESSAATLAQDALVWSAKASDATLRQDALPWSAEASAANQVQNVLAWLLAQNYQTAMLEELLAAGPHEPAESAEQGCSAALEELLVAVGPHEPAESAEQDCGPAAAVVRFAQWELATVLLSWKRLAALMAAWPSQAAARYTLNCPSPLFVARIQLTLAQPPLAPCP